MAQIHPAPGAERAHAPIGSLEPSKVNETTRPFRVRGWRALAAPTLDTLRSSRSDREQRPRHAHGSGCHCASCGRWRHVERHGPRGRPGGGGI